MLAAIAQFENELRKERHGHAASALDTHIDSMLDASLRCEPSGLLGY
jgi:hypothetical protein